VDIMLKKIPGIARTNKLRIIQLLETDPNQVLRAACARNITKLAQNHEGVISESHVHQPNPEKNVDYTDTDPETNERNHL
jgi:hypothetical protein